MATPARVKNTTTPKSTTNGKKVISLTDYVKEQSGYDPDAVVVHYAEAEFYGLTFRLQAGGMNVFNAMTIGDGEDTAATTQAMLRIIHPDDRSAFKSHVAQLPNFDAAALVPLIMGLVSVAAEGKAPSSSGASSRTTAKRVAGSLSAGN